ncbi:CatA-like O-acetyltransferase [Yoonia sp. 208BN28-4]|uniref:CatA-like O-acetyltransferase n=1 Tax=Yoonia sp. 208BN28-4 TaxID=3126505 RepID=UPI0030A61C73
MAEIPIDLATWTRAAQFNLFRTYDRPHYAVTSRIDVTHLLTIAKPRGVSAYRGCLYAIGHGLHAVPELCMRFRDSDVVQHDATQMSMTVPQDAGGFGYGYVDHYADFPTFDAACAAEIAKVAAGKGLAPNQGERDDLAYVSCMPWLDYTSINNALPGPDDCIPRVSWGKFVDQGGKWDMAMTLEVHHALVDGEQVGSYFAAVQEALNDL